MYTPRAFALDDLPEIQQLIQHTRLAQLVTVGENGLQASHLPLLLNPDEGPNDRRRVRPREMPEAAPKAAEAGGGLLPAPTRHCG